MSAQPLRPSRSWYLLAAAALLGSVVWLVLGLVLGFRSLSRQVEGFQRMPIPGQVQVSFAKAGGYLIYFEAPGAAEGEAAPPFNVALEPAGSLAQVPIHAYGGTVTYNLAGHAGRAVGSFQIEQPGSYLLTAAGAPPAAGATVAVGPSIGGDIAATVLRSLAGALVLFLGGAAIAVLVAVGRHRARGRLPAPAVQGWAPAAPAGAPATAWSAGPGGPAPVVTRYVLRQRLGSMAGSFTIADERGQARLTVQGKLLSLGDKLWFHDLDGRELAVVEQHLHLGAQPCYEIHIQGRLAATVRQTGLVGQRFEVELPAGGGELRVTGDLGGNEYAFTRGGRTVAAVSRRWTIGDTYGVEIAGGEDAVLILALMVAVERVHHAEST